MKTCSKCKKVKLFGDFYSDKRRKDGCSSACKACYREEQRNKRAADPEYQRRKRESETLRANQMKKCCACKSAKPFAEFYPDKKKWDGLNPVCKVCCLEIVRKYRIVNLEKCRGNDRQRYADNPEKNKEKNRKRRESDPEYYIKWREENTVRLRDLHRNRLNKDIGYRLRCNLRSRLYSVLVGKQKIGSAVQDLGCTGQFLIGYLESRWAEGMCWNNYGNKKGQWSIDHIAPLSAFNLEDRQHFLLACNYLNLQPMWHLENISKNNTLPWSQAEAA